jgi:hypothetical protein
MATQDSRIKIKRSTVAAEVPTVAPSDNHTDGTWDALDIYKGELFLNQVDNKLYIRSDGGIYQIPINSTDGVIYSASLTIATASVLTLNGTPQTIVAAPGAGKAIELISFYTKLTYNTTAYATNTTLQLITDTANMAQGADTEILLSTASRTLKGTIATLSGILTTDTQLIANKALKVQVLSGNPTAGDSDIVVNVLYRIISI